MAKKEMIDIYHPALDTQAATATAWTNSGKKTGDRTHEMFVFQVHRGPSWSSCSVDNHRF